MPTRREFLKLAAATAAALALPLPSLAEQERILEAIADEVSRRMGLSADEALAQFCTAISRQSLMMIDNADISALKVRQRILEIMPDYHSSLDESYRRSVFLVAIIDELQDQVK